MPGPLWNTYARRDRLSRCVFVCACAWGEGGGVSFASSERGYLGAKDDGQLNTRGISV